MYLNQLLTLLLLLSPSFIILTKALKALQRPFVAIWNAPSSVCEDRFGVELNLTMFDIVSNKGQNFSGKEMVIFYEPRPGLYPYILVNGTFVNGGLPQLVDIANHFDKSKLDIVTMVNNSAFDGLAVIDWESWKPIFKRNLYNKQQQMYVNQSVRLVQEEHPQWNKSKIYQLAQVEFESTARVLMEGTILQGRQLRPFGLWGFYGFPGCYNYRPGQRYCANDTVMFNNRLSWMFSASSALYPSIYLDDTKDRKYKVEGILRESLRVRGKFSDPFTPVYAYTRYRYRTSETYYVKDDLINTIGQSFDAGTDGIVMWEESKFFKSRSNCLSLKNYLDKVLGPLIKQITEFSVMCSISLCYGHGKCINKNWHYNNSSLYIFKRNISDYKCRCYRNWKGKNCNKRLK